MPFEIGDELEDEFAKSERGFKFSPVQQIKGDNHSAEMEERKNHQFYDLPSNVTYTFNHWRPRRYTEHEVYESWAKFIQLKEERDQHG
jgi:hypothetical protein